MPIFQVTTLQTWRNQEVRNIYYYLTNDVLSAQQRQDVADAFANAYDALQVITNLDNDWEYYGVEVRQVDVADLPSQTVAPTAGPVVGLDASNAGLPNQIALVTSFYAPTQAPRRARTYLAGLTESHIGHPGTFGSSIVTAAEGFFTDVDSITVTGDTLLRVAVHWDTVNNVVDDWNRLETFIVRTNPATQRRRRLGSGI